MTKREENRGRILYILQLLWEWSDEQHPITANRLIGGLRAKGMDCNRKTIYADLDALAGFGFDVIQTKQGAYIGKRPFELPELKLLVDAVQASRFITEKKSFELIDKLSRLSSRNERQQLNHQVVVNHRVKTMNESIYYNVDAINEGMQKNRKISFQYWNWNPQKQMMAKRQGKRYETSPWLLMWENEKYYLVGYDESLQHMKHFRVDKMRNIQVEQTLRQGKELYENIDIATYGVENFGMFQGKRETVTLHGNENMAGVLIDRFGKDVWLHSKGQHCVAVVDVVVSNQFFGWITGLGGEVWIEGPQWVKNAYRELLNHLLIEK